MKNKISRLDHLNFSVSNFKESVDWYKKIFNFELVEQGKTEDGRSWGILKSGDSMLAITEFPKRKKYLGTEYHQTFHFCLRLVDEAEWEATIAQNNLKFYYSSPVAYPHSTSWYINDPTGNAIEVSIWKNDTVAFG